MPDLSPLLRRRLGFALLAASLALLARGQWAFLREEVFKGIDLFAIGIFIAAILALILPREIAPPALAPPPPLARGEWLFLVGSFCAAALLRFPGLENCPPGGFYDEAQNAMVASRILDGSFPVFVGGATQMPALYFYPVALAIALFGKSIAAVRAVSALGGALAVPVLYLLARRFFSKSVAAAAAILLIGLRWHLNFSRIGFNGIVSPLLETLALVLLLRALESRRRRDWLAFGTVVAIGLQVYYAFNLFPAVLVVAVAGYLLRRGRATLREEWRPALHGLAWSVVAAGILLAPLAVFAVRNPGQFFLRAGTVVIWNPQFQLPMPETLFLNVRTHFLMFNYHGDGNPRHNLPDAPLLTPVEGVLIAFGVGAVLAKGFKWPGSLLLAWAGIMLLPGILTIEAPQAYRTIGAVPAIVLLMAAGLETLSRLLARRDGRRSKIFGFACLCLAASVAIWNARTYFLVQVKHPLVWQAFDADQKEIAHFLADAAPGHDVFIDPASFDVPILHVYLPADFRSARFRLSDHFPSPASRPARDARPALYVLDGFSEGLAPLFAEAYPRSESRLHSDPSGRPMFVTIEVPAGGRDVATAVAGKGFLASFYSNDGFRGEPALVRRDPAVLFHFHWDADALPDPFSADWAAHLDVRERGPYRFELQAGSPAAVLIDGNVVVAQAGFESPEELAGTIDLEAGSHEIVVRYFENSYLSVVRLWWVPPGATRAVIPLDRLTPMSPAEYAAMRPRLPALEMARR